MGNHHLRQEAAKLCKKWNLGPLYTGKFSANRERLNAYHLKEIIFLLGHDIGQLVCDYGFNHRITGLRPGPTRREAKHWKPEKNSIGVIDVPQFTYDTGYWSCGCGACPDPAIHWEILEERLKNWICGLVLSGERRQDNKEWTARNELELAFIMQGYRLHDNEGRLVPELLAAESHFNSLRTLIQYE